MRETLSFLGLDREGVNTEKAITDAMSYFRWRYGLEHARPVKKIFLPWPTHFADLTLKKVHCGSRRLCYNIPLSNKAVILNLETGEKSTWTSSGQLTRYFDFFWLSDRYLLIGVRT